MDEDGKACYPSKERQSTQHTAGPGGPPSSSLGFINWAEQNSHPQAGTSGTHMKKRNLNASALTEVVMTPTASVMGRDTGDGRNESQGIISSRRRINSEGGQTLVVKERTWPIYLTDMGITAQQRTASELPSIHSGPA